MATLVAPLAFAGAGYALGGTVGMSVGWLIGSWLFGPKSDAENRIFDPGAQEMPSINQSLRGATIPILFGTNRVAPNVVWTKNFNTIRHETKDSAGGGKAGGSGAGMKGPTSGGSTNISYEYKWDLMFHLGMGPSPYSLFGGWVGADRMNDDTLNSIIQGDDSNPIYFLSGVERPRTATLTFDEAYFGFGGPTNSDAYSNWSHFETQEGVPCRWPSTYYVGFKQLNLGNSARVPQLTFEVGPGDITIEYNSNFISEQTPAQVNTSASTFNGQFPQGSGCIKGEDGKRYIPAYVNNTDDVKFINVDDDTVITYTATDFNTFSEAQGLNPSGVYDFSNDLVVIPIADTPYFYMVGHDVGVGLRVNHCAILGKINSNGAIQFLGGIQERSGTSIDHIIGRSSLYVVGRYGEQTTADYILAVTEQSGSSSDPKIGYLPAIDTINGSYTITDDTNIVWDERFDDLGTILDQDFFKSNTYRNIPYDCRGFILPRVSIGIGANWQSTLYCYVGRAETKKHTDNPADSSNNNYIETTAATYPNGFIVAIDLNISLMGVITATGPTIANSRFIDEAGSSIIPFLDVGLNKDDTTGVEADDWMNPSVQRPSRTQGLYLLMWPRIYSGQTPDLEPTGSYLKIKIMIWNPLDEEAEDYGDIEGSWFNSVGDIGVSEPSRYPNVPRNLWPYFDEDQDQLLLTGLFKASADTVGDRHITSQFGDLTIGGGEDVLPPYIIREILTNTVFGMGIDSGRIDETSYAEAIAYCDSEDIRVSVQYNREDNLLAIIDELLSLYGGYLVDSGGNIKFGVQEFTSSTVRTIDNHHLVVESEGQPPVIITKGARQDGYNKVKVNYFDRDLEYRQNIVEISDEVDIDLNGTNVKEFPAKFVMSGKTAQKIADRALWTNLYAKDQYQFSIGWKDADLEPGDVITLVDSYHHELSAGVTARIVRWREKSRGVFDITAVQEIEYAMSQTRSFFDVKSATPGSNLFEDVQPMRDFRMYELPSEFQGSASNIFVGYNQGSAVMGAHLYLSADGISYSLVSNAEPYIISGIFASGLPSRDPGFVENDVELYLMPRSGFTTNTPTWAQTHAIDDVTQATRAVGAGVIIAGSEALSIQDLTLLGQNRYRVGKLYRGWGGTHIQDHSSGAFWHRHGGGMFTQEINEDRVGTLVYYKVVGYNFAGQPYSVASVDAKTYQIQGTYWKPQVPPDLSTFVQSPFVGTNSEDLRGDTARRIHSTGCNVTFTWPFAERKSGYGFGGYGAGGYGNITQTVNTPNYRVNITHANSTTVVHSIVVNTGFFTYDTSQNSSDFNGFNGNFKITITPYNEFGDAVRSRSKTLNLF